MLPSLKDHLFAVEAFFEFSLVFTFAIPKNEIGHLVPSFLQLDTFNDEWAFIAVAMVKTRDLRPKGMPQIFGNDFFLVGYRVFVKYTNAAGKNLRGLYILKSETNKMKMQLLGSIFTRYSYDTIDIAETHSNEKIGVSSLKSNFEVAVELINTNEVQLPASTPFGDWKEARRFAGPLPFTFTGDAEKGEILIIEGVRENWVPQPVRVLRCRFSFFDQMQLPGARLASAFVIENVPYYWKKGKIEKWGK